MIMINITHCFQDIRLFKAIMGVTYAEFTALLSTFVAALAQTKTTDTMEEQTLFHE